MTTNAELTHDLMLAGLDGSNMLGFLAAIGTLRAVTRADKSTAWRLGWKTDGTVWRPLLVGDRMTSPDALIEMLIRIIKNKDSNRAFEFEKNLSISPTDFRTAVKNAYDGATYQDHDYADFIAAFGCESITTPDTKTIQDTAFRTMSGAGHQHFLGFMKKLTEATEPHHLHTSLFEQWQYLDDKPSLRWDPLDDRRHALRWDKPDSKDRMRTMRGANRLAVEALPLLPTAPFGSNLRTTGFSHDRKIFFTWPIWETPLCLDVIRSLLSLSLLQKPQPDRKYLQSIGIVEIYRSQRITSGKYRNFTPAHPA